MCTASSNSLAHSFIAFIRLVSCHSFLCRFTCCCCAHRYRLIHITLSVFVAIYDFALYQSNRPFHRESLASYDHQVCVCVSVGYKPRYHLLLDWLWHSCSWFEFFELTLCLQLCAHHTILMVVASIDHRSIQLCIFSQLCHLCERLISSNFCASKSIHIYATVHSREEAYCYRLRASKFKLHNIPIKNASHHRPLVYLVVVYIWTWLYFGTNTTWEIYFWFFDHLIAMQNVCVCVFIAHVAPSRNALNWLIVCVFSSLIIIITNYRPIFLLCIFCFSHRSSIWSFSLLCLGFLTWFICAARGI